MDKRIRTLYGTTATLFFIFMMLTLMVAKVDVKPLGPEGSIVGFATINQFMFDCFGINLFWYYLTDRLGVIALLFACGFTVLGLCQLIKRRGLKYVDPDILLLGFFYLMVIGCYILFEKVIVNYRPVFLYGCMEPSYPSSHTMIVLCIMSTSILQFHSRIRNKRFLRVIDIFSVLICTATVIGRLISGVHWFTDIAGGVILSAALTMFYYSVSTHLYSYVRCIGRRDQDFHA